MRTKSGRLSRAHKSPELRDNGTFEGQAKRRALVGDEGDPALAATALGILAAKGHINREQMTEGLEYARLRNLLYGAPWPVTTVGRAATEERILELRERFDKKCKRLTWEQKEILTEVAAFNWLPTWFYVAELHLKLLPEDTQAKELLLTGLDALCGKKPSHAVQKVLDQQNRNRNKIAQQQREEFICVQHGR